MEEEVQRQFVEIYETLDSWQMKDNKYLPRANYLLGAFDTLNWVLGYKSDLHLRCGILYFLAAKEKVLKGQVSVKTTAELKQLRKKALKDLGEKISETRFRRKMGMSGPK